MVLFSLSCPPLTSFPFWTPSETKMFTDSLRPSKCFFDLFSFLFLGNPFTLRGEAWCGEPKTRVPVVFFFVLPSYFSSAAAWSLRTDSKDFLNGRAAEASFSYFELPFPLSSPYLLFLSRRLLGMLISNRDSKSYLRCSRSPFTKVFLPLSPRRETCSSWWTSITPPGSVPLPSFRSSAFSSFYCLGGLSWATLRGAEAEF